MKPTLLLGLDGATFTLLNGFMEDGVMPFLKEFTENGACANLLSTICPVTPPAWTTISTGRNPGSHGVFDFIVVDDKIIDQVKFRLAGGQDVLTEPVWSIASRQGVTSASLNYPATNCSPEFDGILVPGFVTSRVLKMSVHPREFWDEVKDLPGFDVKNVSWDLDEGRIPLGGDLELNAFKEWIDYLMRKETGWFVAAKHAFEGRGCGLVCIVFEGVDRLQHQAWALLDPATRPANPTPDEQEIIDACLKYYRHLDDLLRQLVESAGADARTLIVSDHGFGPTSEVFYANMWLAENGYLTWKEDVPIDEDGRLTAHNMREHFESIDWQKTVAYARTTSANGIYIRVADSEREPGVQLEDYHRIRDEIRQGLLDYIDPATGTPVVVHVIDRDEAFDGQAKQHAPDLTLFLRDKGFLSIMRSDAIVRPRSEIKGTHRPEGILIAGGSGIRSGVQLPDQRVLDVTPTVLHSLGLPVPSDCEGGVMSDLFEPSWNESNAVESGPATLSRISRGEHDGVEEEDENVILERLKALGYVE